MLLDIRTVKHSALYGADTHWLNQWRVSAPFSVSDPLARDLASYIVEIEREIHQDHVVYDYVSLAEANDPGSPTPGKADLIVTHGSRIAGFQATPAAPSTVKQALYVQKYATSGRMGRFFFYGCIDQAQLLPSQVGHTILKNQRYFDDILSAWIPLLASNFYAVLTVSHGMMGTGISYQDSAVTALLTGGMSLKNASTRRQTGNGGQGVSIWLGLAEKARNLALWRDTIREWLMFNADFIPVEARDNTISILGEVKALANDVQNYCEGTDNGDGTHGAAPIFRWQPVADELLTIATTLKPAVQTDVDQIQQMQSHPEPDGTPALTHDQADEILHRLDKYADWLAEMVPADWLNPKATGSQ